MIRDRLAGRSPAPPACGATMGWPVSAAVGIFSSIFSCLCRFSLLGSFLGFLVQRVFFLIFFLKIMNIFYLIILKFEHFYV
jgi:hypothetical protein